MWNLPGSGIGPVSPALAGKFFTTELPGKPRLLAFRRLLSILIFALWPPNVILSGTRVCKYFLLFPRLPFYSVDCFAIKAFLLAVVSFVYFWLCCFSFGCHVQKLIAKTHIKEHFPCFLHFMMSVLIIVFIHFELSFVSSVRNGSSFILLHVNIQFPQHYLLTRLSILHWVFLAPALLFFSGLLWLFEVFYGFICIFLHFCKKCHWNLDRNYIDSIDGFG